MDRDLVGIGTHVCFVGIRSRRAVADKEILRTAITIIKCNVQETVDLSLLNGKHIRLGRNRRNLGELDSLDGLTPSESPCLRRVETRKVRGPHQACIVPVLAAIGHGMGQAQVVPDFVHDEAEGTRGTHAGPHKTHIAAASHIGEPGPAAIDIRGEEQDARLILAHVDASCDSLCRHCLGPSINLIGITLGRVKSLPILERPLARNGHVVDNVIGRVQELRKPQRARVKIVLDCPASREPKLFDVGTRDGALPITH